MNRVQGFKRGVAWGFLFLTLCLLAAGCSPQWKKKFIRKKKEVASPPAIMVLEPDAAAVRPPVERYHEHYAYWKSWHSELLGSYGQLLRRDLANLRGVIAELSTLQALLTGKPAEDLRPIVAELRQIEGQWAASVSSSIRPARDRTRLEQLQRVIGKRFHYSNVKDHLIPDPRAAAPDDP